MVKKVPNDFKILSGKFRFEVDIPTYGYNLPDKNNESAKKAGYGLRYWYKDNAICTILGKYKDSWIVVKDTEGILSYIPSQGIRKID